MSNPDLPPELLDHVVDLLQDTRDALKNCCLVAKSWIPRSRRHLFARIAFLDAASLRSWKTTFPDPSTSPASYARFLFVQCSQVVTAADVEEGGWIPTFSQVVHFELWIPGPRVDVDQPGLVLIPFHGFSPALRSLRVSSPGFLFAPVSDLIHSFSCLQDLVVVTYNPFDCSHSFYKQLFALQPPGPLAFRGTLELSLDMGIGPIASRLLSLPNSLHFRELRLARYHEEDILLTTALVERCSPTLEILKIECTLTDALQSSIDLSRAVKLQEAVFSCRCNPQWIITTLRTLTSNHTNLRQISICTSTLVYSTRADHANLSTSIGEAAYQEQQELDHLFAHLWESLAPAGGRVQCLPLGSRRKWKEWHRELVFRYLDEGDSSDFL